MSKKIIDELKLTSLLRDVYKKGETPDELVQKGDLKTELDNLEGDRILVVVRKERAGVDVADMTNMPILFDKTRPDKAKHVSVFSQAFVTETAGEEFKAKFFEDEKNHLAFGLITRRSKEEKAKLKAEKAEKEKEAKAQTEKEKERLKVEQEKAEQAEQVRLKLEADKAKAEAEKTKNNPPLK